MLALHCSHSRIKEYSNKNCQNNIQFPNFPNSEAHDSRLINRSLLACLKGGEGEVGWVSRSGGDSTPFQEYLLMTKGHAAAIQKAKGFNENRTKELLSHILKFNFEVSKF